MKIILLYCIIYLHRISTKILFKRNKLSPTILIMKIDAIGDSIIWLDSAKEYRNHFPNHKLVLLHKKDWTDIALKLPYFDECIPFDQNRFFKSISYRFSLLKKINTYHYEKVINPTFSRNFFLQDWIVRQIHAKEKIGSQGDYFNTNNTIATLTNNFDYYNPKLKKIADKWYTQLLPTSSGLKMELVRNAEFIREYLSPSFQASIPQLPFPLENNDLIPFQHYVVFFMGASTERKMWDIKHFAKIAAQLTEKFSIVVCGSKSESYLFDELMTYDLDKDKILNLCGKTNLIELMSIIQHATFVLSNDTASSHMTVLTKTPSVCILGGGHYGRFQPYVVENIKEEDKIFLPKIVSNYMDCFGCSWICKFPLENGKWKCINSIDSQKVMEKIDEIIEEFHL